MRVLCVGTRAVRGPPHAIRGAAAQNLSRGLRALGTEVVTYGVPVERDAKSLAKSLRQLHEAVQRDQPDVIHALWGGILGVLAIAVGRFARPVVVSFTGSDLLRSQGLNAAERTRQQVRVTLSRIAAHSAAWLVVVSQGLYHALPKRSRDRTSVIPNGIDLELFTRRNRDACRRELGWSPDRKYVLFNMGSGTGAFDNPIKDAPLARAAMRRVQSIQPNVDLIELSEVPHVSMPHYLSAADAALVTSRFEGSPDIVKEALACELPVVSVHCGDVAERIRHVQNCYVVERDTLEIARALQEALARGSVATGGRSAVIDDGLDYLSVASAIPGERQSPVTNAVSRLPFRKHSCENSLLT